MSIQWSRCATSRERPASLTPAAAGAKQTKDQDKPKEPEKPKTIDEVTKDFTKMDGMVTLYRQIKEHETDAARLDEATKRLQALSGTR